MWGCRKAHGPTQHTGGTWAPAGRSAAISPRACFSARGRHSSPGNVEGTSPSAARQVLMGNYAYSCVSLLEWPPSSETDFNLSAFALPTLMPGKGPDQLSWAGAGAREAVGGCFQLLSRLHCRWGLVPAVGSNTCLWVRGAGRQGSPGLCLPCRWKGHLSRAWASSPWRSCTTPLRAACTPAAPAPTRSLRSAASPRSSECPCSATVPTGRPSMHPRYCCPGSVLPSRLHCGKPRVVMRASGHPPCGSAGGSCGRERRA